MTPLVRNVSTLYAVFFGIYVSVVARGDYVVYCTMLSYTIPYHTMLYYNVQIIRCNLLGDQGWEKWGAELPTVHSDDLVLLGAHVH